MKSQDHFRESRRNSMVSKRVSGKLEFERILAVFLRILKRIRRGGVVSETFQVFSKAHRGVPGVFHEIFSSFRELHGILEAFQRIYGRIRRISGGLSVQGCFMGFKRISWRFQERLRGCQDTSLAV